MYILLVVNYYKIYKQKKLKNFTDEKLVYIYFKKSADTNNFIF